MGKSKIFISFDFEHDEDLRNLLVGQSRNPDTPFEITDYSIKEPLTGDWKEKVRSRIRKTDQIIIICGEFTNRASGVSIELSISREENKPYFLLWGRKEKECKKPLTALPQDKIYKWTWDNLNLLISGNR